MGTGRAATGTLAAMRRHFPRLFPRGGQGGGGVRGGPGSDRDREDSLTPPIVEARLLPKHG